MMQLTLIYKTRQSGDTNCPAIYRTDRGTYVIVGRMITDPDTLATASAMVSPGEYAVEVPADVIDDGVQAAWIEHPPPADIVREMG